MSDASTHIQALIEEIVAYRRGRRSRPGRRPSNYAGLKSSSSRRHKYSGCECVNVNGQNIRKLTPRELDEFRDGVQRVIDRRATALQWRSLQ
jgi:hypothetical protein